MTRLLKLTQGFSEAESAASFHFDNGEALAENGILRLGVPSPLVDEAG